MIQYENKLSSSSTSHPDLLAAIEFAYEPSGLACRDILQEAESKEYGAFVFELNNKRIKFRVGKITPTKVGQFVTLWKRIGDGVIQPHDLADQFDFFVISVRNAEHFGQFVFPKTILYEKGIVSKEGKGGKLGIRIYPPWDITESRQAKQSQAWQLKHFFGIQPNESVDIDRVQKLFH
jgi:hypothetical protein